MADDNKLDPEKIKIAEQEAERIRQQNKVKARTAIVGFSGAGKSSLFNAILGRPVVDEPAGGVKGTTHARPEELKGFILVDCPGYGAASMKAPDIILKETMDPHLVLLVLNGGEAVHDPDMALYRVLSRHVKTIVALNKVDILDPSERAQMEAAILVRLGVPHESFRSVSARTGYGVDDLVRLMVSSLPSEVRLGFLGTLEGHLSVKSEEAKRLIDNFSYAGAALGLSPIPFSDFVALYPLQIAMTLKIGLLYGHGDLSAADAAGLVSGSIGTAFAFRFVARQLTKLIPGFGSAVGMATAYSSMQAYGRTITWWFSSGMKMPREALSEYFRNEFSRAETEARAMDFSKLKREREGK